MEISGTSTEPNSKKSYVFDYFAFENLDKKSKEVETQISDRFYRNYGEFVFDLPMIDCTKAGILSNLEFSLYLPDILYIELNKPSTEYSKEDEHLSIVYDRKKKLIRVDDLKANYYEIVDLEQKNVFYFSNSAQCTPFYYRDKFSKTVEFARSFIDEIYALKNEKFYHVGQKILFNNTIAQVFEFELSKTEEMKVITMFTKKVNSLRSIKN